LVALDLLLEKRQIFMTGFQETNNVVQFSSSFVEYLAGRKLGENILKALEGFRSGSRLRCCSLETGDELVKGFGAVKGQNDEGQDTRAGADCLHVDAEVCKVKT
jgi:hypothetical protein